MGRYRVCFDGKWQGDFDDEAETLGWAREVADTGRLVFVARSRFFLPQLIAVFPEERAEEGRWLWKARDRGWVGPTGAM
jgi:hypothetical protein